MTLTNEIKTMDEATKFYNQEFEKIEKMETSNNVKADLLNQLNRTMTNIYESLK